jgi:NAD(P)-dependent dehydrogenase (short-subunit alcohol dehydrogenase family)
MYSIPSGAATRRRAQEVSQVHMQLAGRVAVVTGAGQGLGEAIARRFSHEGACVAILELNPAAGEHIASQLPGARPYQVDVTDLAALEATLHQVHADFGRLDILVNNAGITRDRTLKNMQPDEWDAVIRTNLTGVWNGCKAALPYLLQAGGTGRIISLSSTSYLGNFGQTNYAASKAGVVGLTRTLALEVARAGVTVNAIAPGFIDTAMTRAMPPAVFDRAVAAVPLGRAGQPCDVAGVAAFLASDDAAYITGQVLFVCGGYSVSHSLA